VVVRIRKDPGDTRVTKDPEGAERRGGSGEPNTRYVTLAVLRGTGELHERQVLLRGFGCEQGPTGRLLETPKDQTALPRPTRRLGKTARKRSLRSSSRPSSAPAQVVTGGDGSKRHGGRHGSRPGTPRRWFEYAEGPTVRELALRGVEDHGRMAPGNRDPDQRREHHEGGDNDQESMGLSREP
jgi:hypothetical protein